MHDSSRVEHWNLFRKADPAGLFCAVPQSGPLPNFLFSGHWRFYAPAKDDRFLTKSFDRRVAPFASKLNGFYLFTSFEPD